MRPFSRRSVLRGAGGLVVGTVLAGCVTGGRLRRYRVTNDDVLGDLPANIEAEAFTIPTEEHPLQIRVTFTSTADEPTVFSVGRDGSFPFGTAMAENQSLGRSAGPSTLSGPQRIVVAPAGAGALIDRCWKTTASDARGWAGAGDSSHVRLAPDESVTAARHVLNDDRNGGCYPLGVYRFTETYWVGDDVSARSESSGVRWGFTLEISDLSPDE